MIGSLRPIGNTSTCSRHGPRQSMPTQVWSMAPDGTRATTTALAEKQQVAPGTEKGTSLIYEKVEKVTATRS